PRGHPLLPPVPWMPPLPSTDVPVVPAGARAGRRAWEALEPLHHVIYFAPDVHEHFVRPGPKGRLMPYFAQRAAVLGAVGPGQVPASFYPFNPVTVASSIPEAWAFTSPADVVAARFEAADRCLRGLLGDEGWAAPVAGGGGPAR